MCCLRRTCSVSESEIGGGWEICIRTQKKKSHNSQLKDTDNPTACKKWEKKKEKSTFHDKLFFSFSFRLNLQGRLWAEMYF